MIPARPMILVAALVLALPGCAAVRAASTATDVAVGTTKLAVGTTRVAVRGAAAGGRVAVRGARRLSGDGGNGGTLACVDARGEVYAAAQTLPDGRTTCPLPM